MHPPVCRVTLQGPERRLDLVVPSSLPVADLLPGLVRLGGGEAGEDGGGPWALARPLGPDLPLGSTLQDGEVRDGDVLLLRSRDAPPLGLLRSDPVVRLGAEVDGLPGDWSDGRRAALSLALLGPVLLALLVVLVRAASVSAAAAGSAVLLAALLFGAGRVAPRDALSGAALAVLAALPGGALGWLVDSSASLPARLGWTALGVGVGALLAALVRPARGPAAGVAVAGLVLAVSGWAATTGAGRASAVAAVLAVALLAAATPAALRVAGLLDPEPAGSRGSTSVARAAAVSLTAGAAGAAALLAGVVGFVGGASGRWFAAAVGVALVLRARSARRTGDVLALVVPGVLALSGAAAACTLRALADGRPVLAAAPLLGLAIALVVAALPEARPLLASPTADRRARQLEAVALLALIPLAVAVSGALGAVADAASGLR